MMLFNIHYSIDGVPILPLLYAASFVKGTIYIYSICKAIINVKHKRLDRKIIRNTNSVKRAQTFEWSCLSGLKRDMDAPLAALMKDILAFTKIQFFNEIWMNTSEHRAGVLWLSLLPVGSGRITGEIRKPCPLRVLLPQEENFILSPSHPQSLCGKDMVRSLLDSFSLLLETHLGALYQRKRKYERVKGCGSVLKPSFILNEMKSSSDWHNSFIIVS